MKENKKIKIESINLDEINKNLIVSFLNWLETKRKSNVGTRNQRLAVIHAFFRYIQIEAPEHIYLSQQILAIRSKKKSKPVVNYLSLDGIKEILAQPNTSNKSGLRDLVLLTLLYDSGARVQEIADLKIKDIRLRTPATIKLTGKGDKSRLVPLLSKTTEYIKQYLEVQNLDYEDNESPLFFNKSKDKLTRAGISYILNKYVTMVRLNNPQLIPETVSPHCFRHSKAMHLLESGINLVYIRDFLGHTTTKVTEIYARANEELKRKALEKAYQEVTPKNKPSWQNDNSLLNWLQDLCK